MRPLAEEAKVEEGRGGVRWCSFSLPSTPAGAGGRRQRGRDAGVGERASQHEQEASVGRRSGVGPCLAPPFLVCSTCSFLLSLAVPWPSSIHLLLAVPPALKFGMVPVALSRRAGA